MNKLSLDIDQASKPGRTVESTIEDVLAICQETILLVHNSSVANCQQMEIIATYDLAELADQILEIEVQLGQLKKSYAGPIENENRLRSLIGDLERLLTSKNQKISLH